MFFPVPPQPKEAAVNNKRHDDKQSRRVRAVVEGGGVHSIGKTNRAAADPHSNMPPGSSRSSLRRGGQWSPFDEGIRTGLLQILPPPCGLLQILAPPCLRVAPDPCSSSPQEASPTLAVAVAQLLPLGSWLRISTQL
jgi:hypothetical protein